METLIIGLGSVVLALLIVGYVWRQWEETRAIERGELLPRQVERALRKRYGSAGYRIDSDGLIMVSVCCVDGPTAGSPWWAPFGNLHNKVTHELLARILAE